MRPVRLQIPAEAGFIDVVRICLTGVAAKRGFAYEDIEDMKVAVSEACSNAVLHGRGEGGGEAIDITFEQTDTGLTVRIVNYGLSFDHAAALLDALECVGLTVVFFVANLALGAALTVVVRAMTPLFVSLYLSGDVSLLVLSALQALVYQRWRRLDR